MVRRSHELADVEAEAGVPYEGTRLAQHATRARKRLAWLFFAAAALLVAYGIAASAWGWYLVAVAVGGAGLGVRADRLGGLVAAGLLATVGVLLPLALFGMGTREGFALVGMVGALGLSLAMMPDIITLIRDAELQHAFGRWARR